MAPKVSLREKLISFNTPLSDKPQDPIVTRIQQDLRDTRARHHNYLNEKFLPNDELDNLLTRDTISNLITSLTNLSPCELDSELAVIIDQIDPRDQRNRNHSRKRILAILIIADIPISIIHFIEAGIWDTHLPFEQSSDGRLEYTREDGSRGTCPLQCFNNDHSKLDMFEMCQVNFVVPYFKFTGGEIHHYNISSSSILPFEKGKDVIHTPGGNSQVIQVAIHHSHHDLNDGRLFAMKRLLSSTDEDFNNEVEALKLVRKLRHPHLVKLLGTFKYRDSYYLIFRWAVDDLKTFWQNSPFPNPDATRSTWTLQQCLGIAKGLQLIHRGRFLPGRSILRGRHGDIKPANILRYAPRAGSQDTELGVLKISDFGLTRFHHNHSHQREYTNGPLATRTYRAPEGDLKHTISDSWDLWSLGCLYLEFITWLLQGWDGVTTFSEERKREDQSHYWEVYEDKFFNLTKAKVFGACVKDSVTRVRYCLKSKCDGRLRLKQHIRALHNHPECTDLIHDFLDVISEDLIRIRCDERAKCYEVVRKLEAMKENVLEDEAYYTKGQGRFVTRGTYESDKSCNPTVGLSNPGHAYHHEGGYDDAGKSSKTPGLASESGGEDNSLVRIKNQHSKRRHLSGLLNFLKSCFQSGTRDLGGNANR